MSALKPFRKNVRETGKNYLLPATVVDVVGDRCSVRLAQNGQLITGIPYAGNKPGIGQGINVDFVSGSPMGMAGAATAEASSAYTPRAIKRGAVVSDKKIQYGSLDDLTDVVITSIAQKDLMYYDGTQWINKPAADVLSEFGAIYPPSYKLELDEPKASADTPDDDFGSGSLDGKWTAVSGASGTCSLTRTDTTAIYDLASRSGWMLVQVGSNNKVELRQDFTLADGYSLILAVAPALLADGGIAANEIWVGLALNDNDAGYNSGNYAYLGLDEDSNDLRFFYRNQAGTIVGHTFLGVLLVLGRQVMFRILRSGLDYYAFYSWDGLTWVPMTKITAAAAYNNAWIVIHSQATFGTPIPIQAVSWIRQGGSGVDPW